MTQRRSPPPDAATAGHASPADVNLESPATSTSPHMPHERDEAVGATGGVPSERVRQGHRDLKRGLQDTSRAPEADRAYEKQKR